MSRKKFAIECEMEERWIDYFCSMLKNMEWNGKIGHSSILAFYSDGDGDFRPNFNISTEYARITPNYCDRYSTKGGKLITEGVKVESLYDAG